LQNKPVLARRQDEGDLRFAKATPSNMNTMVLSLNLTHRDPVPRQIIRSKDFRVGLSHAINRQEISDVAYQRRGEPCQHALPASPRRQEAELHQRSWGSGSTEGSRVTTR
jgi:peptide/nickel transport system substrate-binding protein